MGIVALAIAGIEDHVHSLVELPPTMSLSKALNLLKSNSSCWMSKQRRGFSWQEGYGAFAVSVSNLATVKRYVPNQQAHHRVMTSKMNSSRFRKSMVCNTIPDKSSISAAPTALNSSSSLTQRFTRRG